MVSIIIMYVSGMIQDFGFTHLGLEQVGLGEEIRNIQNNLQPRGHSLLLCFVGRLVDGQDDLPDLAFRRKSTLARSDSGLVGDLSWGSAVILVRLM